MGEYDKIIEDLDEEFLKDFSETAHYENVGLEQNLMYLFRATDKYDRLAKIVEILGRLKALCRTAFMDPMVAYVESVTVLAKGMYEGSIPVTEELNELLLLIFDDFLAAAEDLTVRRVIDAESLLMKQQFIKSLHNLPPDELRIAVVDLIPQFLTRVDREIVEHIQRDVSEHLRVKSDSRVEESAASADESQSITEKDFAIIEVKIPEDPNLESFENLCNFVEDRSEFWSGRAKTVMRICLQINIGMGSPVDTLQLAAAVYMHDVAMALLPESVLFKNGKFDSYEVMLLQQHPTLGHDIMSNMESWQAAAQMVHHHHEKFNGTGYPQGLKSKEICTGAKIIALADTFYSLTNSRADRDYSRSGLRALSEINRCNGTQFDPHVVAAFNHVMSLELMG